MPLSGKDVVTRAEMVGRAFMLARQMLCDIEDRVGVQGLNPDWHARNREPPPRDGYDIRARVDRICDVLRLRTPPGQGARVNRHCRTQALHAGAQSPQPARSRVATGAHP